MATSLVINGVSYLYPDTGDQSWGTVASAWAAAVTTGTLQKAGGTFTLTADANFGANFGLLSKYFTSITANAASTGVLRLANTESVSWRNNANGADIALAKDSSDRLTYAGTPFLSSGGIALISGGGTGAATTSQNFAFIGPTSGSGAPGFRALVFGDIPAASAATATTIVARDANGNTTINNLIENYATTATAAGTTTLVVGSAYNQYFTGVTTQTLVLPDATTLVLGQSYFIVNLSSGIVTVNKNGGTLVQSMASGSFMTVTVTNIGSAAGSWNPSYSVNNAGGGTVTSVTFTGDGTFLSSTPSSAVITTGTLAASLVTHSANTVAAGPTSGSAASPTFRALVDADMPTGGLNPPGQITMYGGSSAPSGWLLCDGSAVSRTTYAALFTAISTTFGIGDGSTTFNVPDLRGVFPKGAGTTSRTAGKDASGNFYAGTLGTYSTDQMQGHIHSASAAAAIFINQGGNSYANGGNAFNAPTANLTVGNPSTDGSNGTPRTGHTSEPQSLGLNYIIKT